MPSRSWVPRRASVSSSTSSYQFKIHKSTPRCRFRLTACKSKSWWVSDESGRQHTTVTWSNCSSALLRFKVKSSIHSGNIHGLKYSAGERQELTHLLKRVQAVLRGEVQLLTLKTKWGPILTLNITGTSQAASLLCQFTSRSKHYSLWFPLMTEAPMRRSRPSCTTRPHPRKAKQSKPKHFQQCETHISVVLDLVFFISTLSYLIQTHTQKLLLTQLHEMPNKQYSTSTRNSRLCTLATVT